MLPLEGHHFFPHLPFGDRLKVPVERGDHGQSSVLEQLLTIGLLQLGRHPVHEAGRLHIVRGRWFSQRERLSGRRPRLGRGDFSCPDHRVQHDLLARPGAAQVAERIERRRCLWETREQGRF